MERTRLERRAYVGIALWTALSLGCAFSGDDEELEFRVSGFGGNNQTPIAVGATLELNVAENASGYEAASPVRLTSVTSADPGVLSVGDIESPAVTLLGVAPGSSELTFSATSSATGEVLVDTITFEVAFPEKISVWHRCHGKEGQRSASYLTGHSLRLGYEATTENGRWLLGSGYDPIDQSTLSGATLERSSRDLVGHYLDLRAGDAAGDVTFDLDVGTHDLELRLVDAESVDGATLTPLVTTLDMPETHEYLYLDEAYGQGQPPIRQHVRVAPTRQGEVVCSRVALTSVTTATPQVCDAILLREDESIEDTADVTGGGAETMLSVETRTVGTCELDVTFEGITGAQRLSVPVREFIDEP